MNGNGKKKKPRRRTKKQYYEAIRITKGNKTAASRLLGVSRQAVFEACKRYPELDELAESFIDEMLDVAFEVILDKAILGDEWAIDKIIRYWGHRRGWIERKEVTGKEGGALMSHQTRLEAKVAVLLHSEAGAKLLEAFYDGFGVDGVPSLKPIDEKTPK